MSRRTRRFSTTTFAVSLFLAVAGFGLLLDASALQHSATKSPSQFTGASVKTSPHGAAPSFTVQLPISMDSSEKLASIVTTTSLQRAKTDRNASLSWHNDAFYTNLPTNTAIAHLSTTTGIVWSFVPINARSAKKAQSYPIYISHIQAAISKTRSLDLKAVSTLLANLPSHDPTTDESFAPPVLYAGGANYVLGSEQTEDVHLPKRIRYYAITPGHQPILLYDGPVTNTVAVSIVPLQEGVLFASGKVSPFGVTVNQVFYENLATLQKVMIPAAHWPLMTLLDQPDNLTVLSGPRSYRLQTDSGLTQQFSPDDPKLTATLDENADHAFATFFVPSIQWSIKVGNQGRASRLTFLPEGYQIEVTDPSAPSKRDVVKVSLAPQKDAAETSSARPQNSQIQSDTNSFFGPYDIVHQFSLPSVEGPTVIWSEGVSKSTFQTERWFVSFRINDWTYHLGPLLSPANAADTYAVSKLIRRAQTTPPPAVFNGGNVYVWYGGSSGIMSKTTLVFSPSPDMLVHFSGSDLGALDSVQYWTLVNRKK